MKKIWARIKSNKVSSDIVGVCLIITAGLIGWLPGPGGVPLFYFGLRMLSLHHPQAKKALDYFESEGLRILDTMFPDHPLIMLVWDIFVVTAIGLGLYLVLGFDGAISTLLSTSLIVWSLIAFARNRKRFSRVKRHLKK